MSQGRAYRSQSTTKSGQNYLYKTTITTNETQQDELQQNESLLRSILYDFNQSTTTQDKLSQMKNCLNELPLEMIRNVAFLPSDEKTQQKQPKTSKEILDTTKGFTTKMRISFMRIKNSLDPNINASTLQNFFKKKQQECERIKVNYGYSPEIKDSSKIEQSITPKRINPFLTPQNLNGQKQIRTKLNSNCFQLQQTDNMYAQRKKISEIYDTSPSNFKQNLSFHKIQTDSEKTFNNQIKLSPINNKKFHSELSTSDSPQNQYSKLNSTQDKSTLSKNKMNMLTNNQDQQRIESDSYFYDIPQEYKMPKDHLNYQLNTPRAQTTRSLSNTAGRKKMFLSDNKNNNISKDNDNIFNILHSNYNSNPNYPCQKKRTDLTTQNKTTTETEHQEQYFKTNENIPIKTDQSPMRKSTTKVEERFFFQKKVRRNALIDLRKLNPNIQKMTQYSKDFLPPWLRARPDFLKLYLQDQINKNLELPTIFLKDVTQRSMNEKQEAKKYIRTIPQFSQLEQDIIELISFKVRVEIYYTGEMIQEINETCKSIIIVYDGKVTRINKDFKEEQQDKNIALNTSLIRKVNSNEFSLRADNTCIVLALTPKDLQDIENEYAKSIVNEFQTMLTLHDFFHAIESKTLQLIANSAKGKLLFPGETLFNIGDASNEIYFIYFGKIEKKKIFYTQERNRWPTKRMNNQEQDQETDDTQSQHGYRVFTKNFSNSSYLNRMDFFGDQEAIYEVGRRTEAIASESTFLLWLDRQTFLNILTLEDLNALTKFRSQKSIKLSPEQSPEYYFKLEKKNKYHKQRILNALDVVFTHENNLHQLRKLEKRIEPFKQEIQQKFDVKNKMNTTAYQ